MKILYHPTAEFNVQSILEQGLLIQQRGINPYGLDTGFDYTSYYGSEEKAECFTKPNSVHLIKDLETAEWYQRFISEMHDVPAVILEVTLNDHWLQKLHDDPEDSHGYYCLEDIPSEFISRRMTFTKMNQKFNEFLTHHSDHPNINPEKPLSIFNLFKRKPYSVDDCTHFKSSHQPMEAKENILFRALPKAASTPNLKFSVRNKKRPFPTENTTTKLIKRGG